jgi:TATA-binding protein-associated factor
MLQKFLTAVVTEEWAREYDAKAQPNDPLLIDESSLIKDLSQQTLAWLQAGPPPAYHEQVHSLHRIHADCIALLHLFHADCKLPISSIPFLGNEVDPTGSKPGTFNIELARAATGPMFTKLKDSLGRTKKKELATISEKRTTVVASIDRYIEVKSQHDIRVSSAFAATFVSFRTAPDKVSPIVKGIMNGVKVCHHLSSIEGMCLTVISERR